MGDMKAAVGLKRRRSIEERLYDALGSDNCGNAGAPLDWYGFDHPLNESSDDPDDRYVVRLGEDAFTIWIGYPDKWLMHMSRRMAGRFVWWWVKWHLMEWFGLRRWIWYRLLDRRCRNLR